MARRNQIVSIRLNEEEETFLMERISALNISQSEYVRNLIMKDYNESRINAFCARNQGTRKGEDIVW